MRSSLRRQLLTWVLVPLASAVAIDAWMTHESSAAAAAVVQDRLLLGSARMIAEQVFFEDGNFQHQIPPAALELFQSQGMDRIFYRVTTGSGTLLAGYTEFPVPPADHRAGAPIFFDSRMRNEIVRVVAFFQPVIGNPTALPVVVEVAQTTHERQRLTNDLWHEAVAQQLLILALATIFILYGLHRGLQPLVRLRNDVRSRTDGSLEPLQGQRIPSELTPLVDACNDYIQRMSRYSTQRTAFVQNAAHQLRTPLAVLNTQISDALRAADKPIADQFMMAARKTAQQTAGLVNQFLTISAAEHYVPETAPVSTQKCCELVQAILEDLSLEAHGKQIDLGFERQGGDVTIVTDVGAFREIAMNVIDNAIRYTPAHGIVTARLVSTPSTITLEVQDNGPGIPETSHQKIFERFYRIDSANSQGSGLGLAIVKELAIQCGALIQVSRPLGQANGLLMSITFQNAPKA